MDPQQRTKLLAGVLAAIVVLFGGFTYGKRWFLDPVKKKEGQIEALQENVDRLQLDVIRVADARKQLGDWKKQSLPPNDIDASRLYLEWLTDLTEVVEFQDPVVTPTRRETKGIGVGRNRKPLYSAVQVTVKGKTTFNELCRFLYYFHRTNLAQRVVRLTVESEGVDGNPPMEITLTAEALALADAPERSRIFPETTLTDPPGGDPLQAVVADNEGFQPNDEGEPVHVRIGRQFLTVNKMDGAKWTLHPGVDSPPHSETDEVPLVNAGAIVERVHMKDVGKRNYAYYRGALLARGKNPFVLPVEYNPRLRGVQDVAVDRGRDVRLRAEVSDLDPDKGDATFALAEGAPNGMTIDPKTGSIRWDPGRDVQGTSFRATVLVRQGKQESPILRDSFRVTIRDPNRPPTLQVAKSSHEVWVGSTVEFAASGRDPDGSRGLRFSLSGAPRGADISERTGRFEWTPAEGTEPTTYTFDVVVTDSGSPPLRDRRSVSITVRESAEKYTKLTGILADNGQREAWLLDFSTDERILLQEGMPFEAAGMNGFVYVIGREFVEFQSKGKSYRLALGRFLPDRELLVDPEAPVKPDEPENPDPPATPRESVEAQRPTASAEPMRAPAVAPRPRENAQGPIAQ